MYKGGPVCPSCWDSRDSSTLGEIQHLGVLAYYAWINARIASRREPRISTPRRQRGKKRSRGPGHRVKRGREGLRVAAQSRVRNSSPLPTAFPRTHLTKEAANRPRKCGCLYCPCATGCAALPRGSSSSHASTGCVFLLA